MLHLPNTWTWDPCFTQVEDLFVAFYIQADLDTSQKQIGMAESTDLYNWTPKTTLIGPGQPGTWNDQALWPGSVLQDNHGLWHMFYTGVTQKEDGFHQNIGHATSLDLVHWTSATPAPLFSPKDPKAVYYHFDTLPWGTQCLRDPHVFKHPTREGWLMIFAARATGCDKDKAGCIGLAYSLDLMTWSLEKPLYLTPFGGIEHPQAFIKNGRWFITYSVEDTQWSQQAKTLLNRNPESGIHYIHAADFTDTWKMPPYPVLSTTVFAGKVIQTRNRSFVIGNYHGDDRAHDGHLTHPHALGLGQAGLTMAHKY